MKTSGWVKLNNGRLMPPIGIGTWQLPASDELVKALVCAIQSGYRLIDTAAIFENEESVATAISECGLPRKELFVTGKCWTSNRAYDDVLRAFERTLQTLKLDYLDCYSIQWPCTKGEPLAWQSINVGTWRAFERLYDEGVVKAIGVCNFQMHHLVSFLARANVKPVMNQIEFHPGYMQKQTLAYCRKEDIAIQAWSPLGHGTLLSSEPLLAIAAKYRRPVSQVILSWCLSHGVTPVIRSMNAAHQKEDLQCFDIQLTKDDIQSMDSLPMTAFSGLEPDHVSF